MLKKQFLIKGLRNKMIEIENFVINEMKEIKEKLKTLFNRLDHLEKLSSSYKDSKREMLSEIIKKTNKTVKSQEVTQIEYKEGFRCMNDDKNLCEKEDIEIQRVKYFL